MANMSDAFLVAAMLLTASVVFVGVLRHVSFGLVALLLSIPMQAELAVQVGGVELTWTKVALGSAVAAWIIRLLLGASRASIDAISLTLGSFVLALALSIVQAQDLSAWAGETYRWVVVLIVYVIAVDAFRSAQSPTSILIGVALSVTAAAANATWQVVTGTGPATFSVDGVTRAYATFGEPNPFAGYLELSVLLLIAVVIGWTGHGHLRFRSISLSHRTILALVIAAFAGSAALVSTQSRGGYIGFLAGLGVIVLLSGRRIRWIATIGGGVCLVLVLLSPIGARVIDRFRVDSLSTGPAQVTTSNWAAQERAGHWRAAVAMAKTSPITGIGAGNYNRRYREMTAVWRFRIPRGHAHNAYLQAFAQAGLIGGLTYLAVCGAVLREIVRALKHQHDQVNRTIVIGVAAVSTAVAIHNLVEYLHVLSLGIQLAIVWALLTAWAKPTQERDQSGTQVVLA